jgi:signal transduction histidine kinase/ActR/RegA family two-component response regulator
MWNHLRLKISAWWIRFRDELRPCSRSLIVTVAVGVCLTLALFIVMLRFERREKQAVFNEASSHLVEAIRRSVERIELVHEIIRQDFYGSPSVSSEEFSLCSEPCLAYVPSLKVLQWAPRVSNAEREAFLKQTRQSGLKGFNIVQPDAAGHLTIAPTRAEYFPILYAASKTGFQASFGWDFASNPALRQAIDECRDKNTYVVSPLVDLSQFGIRHPVVQTFLPVYDHPKELRTVDDRRRHFRGVLVGLCQVDDLVINALNYAENPRGIDLAVFDGSANDRSLLHLHASRTRFDYEKVSNEAAVLTPNGIHATVPLNVGHREWLLVCTPAPNFFAAHLSWRSWAVLIAGLCITFAVASRVNAMATRTARIERIVDERTAELRKKDEQLRQSQKLEAVGALAGGIAHEFNNLLQGITGYTRYALEALKPDQQAYRDLECVLEASDRAAALTRQLLSFSRRETMDRTVLETNQTIDGIVKMLHRLLGEQIEIKLIAGKDIAPILADAGSLQQVLLNLCLNARDAMPMGGEIIIKTQSMCLTQEYADLYDGMKPGHYVEISVTDTGFGMPPEVRDRIFEPFFTTKPVGKGTGLGLAMVYGIVQQHEGAIHVYSEVGRGTTFKIYIPACQTPSDQHKETAPASPQKCRGSEIILLAEDDPMVRDIGRQVLQRNGYTVIAAVDGEDAVAKFAAHKNDIGAVMLDVVMPRLNGHDVYQRIKELRPDIPVLFCSGYDPDSSQSNFIVREHLRLVEKPYDPAVLLRTLREVLDAESLCPT